MCPIPWLYVSYRGYAWLYMVIYCNVSCNEKESEPCNDNQGRPPIIMTSATSRKISIWWFYVVIRPKPWLYVLVHGYTNLSSPDVATSYQENPEEVMCPIPWLYVSYRGYAWLYMVIYCKCNEKESEPCNDNQGRQPRSPIIMTSATSRKYSIRWFYVVLRPKTWL